MRRRRGAISSRSSRRSPRRPPSRLTTVVLRRRDAERVSRRRRRALLAALRERFALPAGAEFTVEANPDRGLCAGFAAYRAAGITRISFGVQSFDPAELRELGRRHIAADVGAAVDAARAARFRQHLARPDVRSARGRRWPRGGARSKRRSRRSRARVDLRPDRRGGHALREVVRTRAGRVRRRGQAATLRRRDRLLEARASSTTRSATSRCPASVRATTPTTGRTATYLGFGVGAASYRGGVRSTATRDLRAYEAAAAAGDPVPADEERLGARPGRRSGDAGAADGARGRRAGLCGTVRRRLFSTTIAPVIAEMRSLGLLDADGGRVALTRRGRFLANEVCAAFIEPALGRAPDARHLHGAAAGACSRSSSG